MNKIFAITTLLLFVVCSTSFAAALASGGLTNEGDQLYGGPDATAAAGSDNLIGKFSKGVIAGVNFDNLNYAVNTKHTSGTQAFGTADDSTAIYRTTLGTGALTTAPTANDNTAFAAWTEM